MTHAEQERLSQSRYGSGADDGRSTRRGTSPDIATRSEGAESYTRRRKRRGRRKAVRGILIALLVIVAGAGTALALYVNDINSRLSSSITDELREVLSVSEDVEYDDPFYMLLLGVDKSDEREADWGDSSSNFRSDTIILARIDPKGQKVTLVSIPRDTMVDMGSYGTQKINAAYSYGGASYMVEVVEELSGIQISHYAEVDFEQFTSIVDTVGGIEVTLPVAVQDSYSGVDLPAGTQTIDGTQALALARSRHAYDEYGAGDFYRAANQRMIIAAVVKKVLSLDVIGITNTISELANSVTTDLSATDIVSLAMQFVDLDTENDIYSGQLPTTSAYINELWYEIVNETEWKAMMERVDSGLPPYEDSDDDPTAGVAGSVGNAVTAEDLDGTASTSTGTTSTSVSAVFQGDVVVYNAAQVNGLAARICSDLEDAGFTATARTASSQASTTAIYYNNSNEGLAVALGVASTLSLDEGIIERNDGTWSTDFDVVVVVGSDNANY